MVGGFLKPGKQQEHVLHWSAFHTNTERNRAS